SASAWHGALRLRRLASEQPDSDTPTRKVRVPPQAASQSSITRSRVPALETSLGMSLQIFNASSSCQVESSACWYPHAQQYK
ncbi:MAG: hypothetical protein WCJ30_26780, partial [Deltaproteobacteria bacterium]